MKFFLADAARHKARGNQLDCIGAFLQATVKSRVFVELKFKYAGFFPHYKQYCGWTLRLVRLMYGMTISGKLFADELTNWLVKEAGFSKS